MRVLTINTWNGVSMRGFGPRPIEPVENKARRADVLLAQLRQLDADVVLLQECVPDPKFSRWLATELGMHHLNKVNNGGVRAFGVGFPLGIGAGEGLAMLTRDSLAPRSRGARKLYGVGATSNTASIQLSAMYHAMAVGIEVGGEPVTVVNTHLPCTFPDQAALERAWESLTSEPSSSLPEAMRKRTANRIARRDRTVRKLRDWVGELARTGPVIVGGDFNLATEHPDLIELAESLSLTNVLPARDPSACTWDLRRNRNVEASVTLEWFGGGRKGLPSQLMAQIDREPTCLDHLLVSEALAPRVTGAGMAFVEAVDGVQASDHFGVWLDLAL